MIPADRWAGRCARFSLRRVEVWLALCGGLLCGCSTLLSPPDPAHALPHQELSLPRGTITGFLLEGRISVRSGERAHHGGVIWQHTPDTDRLLLTGPMGQGMGELRRDRQGVRFTDPQGRISTAKDWETLAREKLGADLPMGALPRWVLADVPAIAYDSSGRASQAHALGWTIRYFQYASDEPHALPVDIGMQRDDIELRLRIDRWLDE